MRPSGGGRYVAPGWWGDSDGVYAKIRTVGTRASKIQFSVARPTTEIRRANLERSPGRAAASSPASTASSSLARCLAPLKHVSLPLTAFGRQRSEAETAEGATLPKAPHLPLQLRLQRNARGVV